MAVTYCNPAHPCLYSPSCYGAGSPSEGADYGFFIPPFDHLPSVSEPRQTVLANALYFIKNTTDKRLWCQQKHKYF